MIKLLLTLLAVAAAAGSFQSTSAQAPVSGSMIGSETAVFSVGNSSSFEARISANSSFIVPTVLVEATNGSGSSPLVDITEWRIYDTSSAPFTDADLDGPLAVSDGRIKSIVGSEVLPAGVPEDGGLGIVFTALGMNPGDQVKVTFIYAANAGTAATAEIAPTREQLPLVVENFELQSDPGLAVDNSFVNPEIHCEICTAVRYTAGQANQSEAAYVAEETDLAGAQILTFWARGDAGNETATFKAAGKVGENGTIAWANTTSTELGQEWRMYEIGLAGADLAGITHLFGFEVRGDSSQTFYLKGITYN